MTNSIKVVFASLTMMLFAFNISAQQVKLAHVNTAELMQQLITKDSVEYQLEQLQKEMQMDLQQKQATLNKNYQEYLGKKDTLSQFMVKTMEESLRNEQQQLEALPQQYEQLFQSRQGELIQPIRLKVEEAIKKLAAAGKYTYVFDSSTILYTGGGTDITDLVRIELGLPKIDPNQLAPTSPLLIPGQ